MLHRQRGVLDLVKENWETGPSTSKNEVEHILDLRAKLHSLGQLSREHLLQAQKRQQHLYNRGAKRRQFSAGDKVLILIPSYSSKFLAKWQGPFVVTQQVRDVDYEVVRSDRGGATQIYHLNLLKAWKEVTAVSPATTVIKGDELGPEVAKSIHSAPVPFERADVALLQLCFAYVFSLLPGSTSLIHHHIETSPGVTVRSQPYQLPEHKRKIVLAKFQAMLEMGVIEESSSDWCRPIVLVRKSDGSILCGLSQGQRGVQVRCLSNAPG